MSFILEDIINQIHANYTALTGDTVCAEFGNIQKARNADAPRIVWTLSGGQFGSATKIGGPDAAMAQAFPSFWIWLWFDDLETCWNAMCNVLSAIRTTVYGPNLGLLKFDCPTEVEGRNLEKGAVIVLTVTLSVPLRVDGTVEATEVELDTHSSTVTEDDGELDDDGNYEPFETVLVTGPIP